LKIFPINVALSGTSAAFNGFTINFVTGSTETPESAFRILLVGSQGGSQMFVARNYLHCQLQT
jgi:hypothetical protein